MENNKNSEILKTAKENANKWLEGNYDEETKAQVKFLMENDEKELVESFHSVMEFGTGGLRGIMGVGTNRMNKYTVGITTQGIANYLKKQYGEKESIKVAIAYDCRNNSQFFAQVTADILSNNDITVYLFEELRPLPELSFTVRYKKCHCGIVITSSHNPKEYNGIKVFGDDGAQVIYPHDENIIREVKNIQDINEVKFTGNKNNIISIGEEIDNEYLKRIKQLSFSGDLIKKHKDLKIVYTPIHGTGITLVPKILKEYGFENIYNVPEQDVIDGNFPTVRYPNPEETDALDLAIQKAKQVDADLILATDPDADRVAVAIKNNKNEYTILNGNQSASLLVYYILNQWKNRRKLTGKEFIIKTIVTSELLKDIALKNGVECYDVLTGFKWIAKVIRDNENQKKYICGGEESIGFLIGDFIRDKDSVGTCAMVAETAAWAAEQGKTLFDILIDIYLEYGFYKERLLYLVKQGISGKEEIGKIMANYRNNPMASINDSKVIKIKDFQSLKEKDLISGEEYPIDLPKSNVLQFYLEDGSKVSVRPSGTEPKIKYYFEVKDELSDQTRFEEVDNKLNQKIDGIMASFGLK
ncbi:phospho-sugar mutase [candidate division KSB1 bacterium]|nr:phospho-sugar mutase [candidate division KSB1 bacterium]MBL7095604.1 phospho-sugar mutase [candidate division KSB1 bacterium]